VDCRIWLESGPHARICPVQTRRPAGVIQTFQYARPPSSSRARTIVELCDGDNLRGEVHILRPSAGSGVRHNLAADELWFVLRGRARAIGPGGTLIGEFATGDGLLIPRETRCRFLNVGGDDLELLLVSGFNLGRRPAASEIDADEREGGEVERLSGRVL